MQARTMPDRPIIRSSLRTVSKSGFPKRLMNLEDDEKERYGLRFVGYEGNEYELIEYDVTSN